MGITVRSHTVNAESQLSHASASQFAPAYTPTDASNPIALKVMTVQYLLMIHPLVISTFGTWLEQHLPLVRDPLPPNLFPCVLQHTEF